MPKIKKVKEPFAHIVKRDNLSPAKAWGIRAIAIVGGFVFITILLMAVLKGSPDKVITSMFEGAFGTRRTALVLFRDLSILLIIALAVTPAFKMKFWNIGAEGQVLISAYACVFCMYKLGGKVPDSGLIVIMFIASVAAGIVWAVIPAIFKAKWGTNETLFTLMMNYVAVQIVLYTIKVWVPGGTGQLPPQQYGNLPPINGEDYGMSMIFAAILTLLVFIYFRFSKHGYEVSIVGESSNTARYIGISVPKVIVRTLVLSGAICGIAGFLIAGGIDHTVSATTVGGRGFTAVLVSWLGQFNPIAMVATSFIVVFLSNGTSRVMSDFKVTNHFFASVVTGIMFLILIACEFFIRYKVIFRKDANKQLIYKAEAAALGDADTDKIQTDTAVESEEAE